MSDPYDFRAIEHRWQAAWQREGALNVQSDAPDVYVLEMFPGPSGPLHMGHAKNYVIGDVVARYGIRKGDNVFHPMGWDAFGLPAEIAAIKQRVHPREWTQRHIEIQKKQFRSLGIHHDWTHEISTSDPGYYRWNQWLFLKLYERGLAYQAERDVNWCPQCNTTLANEEVIAGVCERCDTPVAQKSLRQWFLKITAYADDLLNGLDGLSGWPDRIKTIQRNWIGRSENASATFEMRDWCISRQRYWGTPIPIVHCNACGPVPVPEADLPVRLPHIADFAPDGRAPLARASGFVRTSCPACARPARRECDTMTGFVCSSWYFLRFTSPHSADRPFDPDAARRWLPVAYYIGGKEHATGHLMYARFITRFLKDIGQIDIAEPFTCLFNQGVVHKDGTKMSKSRGNAVSIEHMVETYGADTARVFVLFATPPDQDMTWSDSGAEGIFRFLNRVWRTVTSEGMPTSSADPGLKRMVHRTIRAVTADMERLHHNTAISRLMELTTAIHRAVEQGAPRNAIDGARKTLVALLAPFAPHIAEDLWHRLGYATSVHRASWPAFDPDLATEPTATIAVQINGKTRDRIDMPRGSAQSEVERATAGRSRVQKHLAGRTVSRTIYVPDQLINFIISE